MSYVTPNHSILRSSSLEASIRVLNTAQKNTSGNIVNLSYQKAYAPPFVNSANEFQSEHIGRFYYIFQTLNIEKLCALFVFMSFFLNLFVDVLILIEDFCITEFFFGQQLFYIFALIIPISSHYIGIRGIRKRELSQIVVFLAYSVLQVSMAVALNSWLIIQNFMGLKCSTHLVLAASLMGALAFFQTIAGYFAYENMCYLKWHVQGGRYRKQRRSSTRANTTINKTAFENHQFNVEPSETINDTLEQVINTWQYQRDRRRKSQNKLSVKFDKATK